MDEDALDDIRASITELTVQSEGKQREQTPATFDADTGREIEERKPTQDVDTVDDPSPRVPAKSVSEDGEPSEKKELTPAKEPKETKSVDRAPVSWKPASREHWAALPAEVRSEVTRREQEIAQTLQRTATERKYANEIFDAITPFEHHLRADGATHVQAVTHLMQMAHALRSGSVQQKASLIAELCFRYSVDLKTLDSALMYMIEHKKPMTDPVAQAVQQELAPIREFMSKLQNTQQATRQQTTTQLQAEMETFMNDPANEFAADVAMEMADLLDLAANRGQILSLSDAYRRATMAHPQISQILIQRQHAQAAQRNGEAVQRARQAAASAPDDGAPSQSSNTEEDVDDMRSAIQASIRSLTR